ncbi:MAG: alpha-L-fucosidase [Chitinophagaceae bacterium]|nr:alpha-L-fucosidase [Chitinophagaceae bacterium]
MGMKRGIISIIFLFIYVCTTQSQPYEPSAANKQAREWFTDARFGMFIHWGPFSIPGSGEWVMNNRNITVKNYTRLEEFFNPIDFNAAEWVSIAKNAGMKYITLITRHHDGFSMWDTRYSDFNIMHTPYKKDIVKMMADECHKQGIKIFFYYSLLDWRREDYPHETGRTGQGTGRKGKGNYASYLQFMKNQLTELLTNYGEVAGIWFDGHWDQTNPEGSKDRSSRIDWKYDEIYGLIHRLQPQCLIGNNHHMSPFPGEDFQMFEKDLPHQNTSGLNFQKPSDDLPLETCETINGSWGFNLTDTSYKSEEQLVHLLVNAAGNGANLLLNVGPMPNGKFQPEFVSRLAYLGNWMQTYGESIYGTHRGFMLPQPWGCVTEKNDTVFIHLLKKPGEANLNISGFPYKKIISAAWMKDNKAINFTLKKAELTLQLTGINMNDHDAVMVLRVKK